MTACSADCCLDTDGMELVGRACYTAPSTALFSLESEMLFRQNIVQSIGKFPGVTVARTQQLEELDSR